MKLPLRVMNISELSVQASIGMHQEGAYDSIFAGKSNDREKSMYTGRDIYMYVDLLY